MRGPKRFPLMRFVSALKKANSRVESFEFLSLEFKALN
jgi:hypothetical protein